MFPTCGFAAGLRDHPRQRYALPNARLASLGSTAAPALLCIAFRGLRPCNSLVEFRPSAEIDVLKTLSFQAFLSRFRPAAKMVDFRSEATAKIFDFGRFAKNGHFWPFLAFCLWV